MAQTTFPQKWRQLPLHLWDNSKPFSIEEKMRGMGQKKPPGVNITRSFWLDENGKELTYMDQISGNSLQTWRLDAADGQRLGAAKIGNESQLITKNPVTGATGVEVRVRNLNLQSVGRMDNKAKISATGWETNADSLSGTLYLPPGWRAFAVLGADSSSGDCVTKWSLLDVFLILVITVAIFKLWGWKLSMVALLSFVLAYHEQGAPRLVWLLLLISLIITNAVKNTQVKNIAKIFAYLSIVLVLFKLVPFAKNQIQQAIYPQLEAHSVVGKRNYSPSFSSNLSTIEAQMELDDMSSNRSNAGVKQVKSQRKSKMIYEKQNLKYDSKAKIQTGPAVPEWSWRSVSFSWSGPVSANENVSFLLIPLWLERLITIARVLLLGALLYGLIRQLKGGAPKMKDLNMKGLKKASSSVAAFLVFSLFLVKTTEAQIPDATLLNTLKERVSDESLKGTQFVTIPEVNLSLDGMKLSMEVRIHTAKRTAVPLPGRLPVWSPVSVTLANGDAVPIGRHNGYLWVVLDEGTHQVNVEGLVPAGDWQWSFALKPQYVNIDALNWTVTGVKENGIPENQVFFVEQNKSQNAEIAYDKKDYNPIFKVDRVLELGLIWQSTTTVNRLSPLGKAVSLSLPLLPGERILTPGVNEDNGRIEIRLGAQQQSFSWESQLEQIPEILLLAEKNEQWVEEWQVITSAIWNVSIQDAPEGGLEPIYANRPTGIVPIWKPWPGEKVSLKVARPKAIAGETLTIKQAIHKMNLGARQRTSSLKLSLQNSLGMDFILSMAKEAEVSSLRLNGKETPVRKEGESIIIPLRPGEQTLELVWKMPSSFSFVTLGDEVKLPVDCANASTVVTMPYLKRWVLWTDGPLRGPAVRMWPLLIVIILAGWFLGRIKSSPLKWYEWILLFIGLTQIPLICAFLVTLYFFWISFKSAPFIQKIPRRIYNLNQLVIIAGAIPCIIILLIALYTGLLGSPEMRIIGENSNEGNLRWFQARGEGQLLPIPKVFSVSIWFYRGMMLLWAVWLSFTLIRWTKWAWSQLELGGLWKPAEKNERPEKEQSEQKK